MFSSQYIVLIGELYHTGKKVKEALKKYEVHCQGSLLVVRSSDWLKLLTHILLLQWNCLTFITTYPAAHDSMWCLTIVADMTYNANYHSRLSLYTGNSGSKKAFSDPQLLPKLSCIRLLCKSDIIIINSVYPSNNIQHLYIVLNISHTPTDECLCVCAHAHTHLSNQIILLIEYNFSNLLWYLLFLYIFF